MLLQKSYADPNAFLIKYDNQGAFIWARFIEEINGDMITSWSRAGQGLAVDSFENIYVIGIAWLRTAAFLVSILGLILIFLQLI